VGTCCQRLRLINLACNVGDEGGFAPNVTGADESLDLLTEAIKEAGYTGKVQIGLDAASSEFYKEGKYDLDFKVSRRLLHDRVVTLMAAEPQFRLCRMAHRRSAGGRVQRIHREV